MSVEGTAIPFGDSPTVSDSSPRKRPLKLFVIAGENSGDIHGANVFHALNRIYPNYKAWGLGGKRLKEAGVRLLENIVEHLAIIGIVPVIMHLPEILKLLKQTKDFLRKTRPDAVILVDYPGFNIKIAEAAKKMGIPVVWYISPQIWAWHHNRLYKLAKVVDRMIVIFPFELPLYKEEGVDAVHVGHPLFDVIHIDMDREEVCQEFGLDPDRAIVSIVPGSRRKEVKGFLPIMLEGARRYQEYDPDAQFVIIRASTIQPEMIETAIEDSGIDPKPVVVDRLRYNVRNWCDFSWVKSGTSTLEAALLGSPMLIVYRVNTPTWIIGKQLFTIGYIGLPNIVAGDRIVPELLQDEFTPRNLAEKTRYYLMNEKAYADMKVDLNEVRAKLGGPGASEKAARAVLDLCGVDANIPEGNDRGDTPSPIRFD